LSLRCNSRSSSLTRRRSCRASMALAARGSPRPAIASRFRPPTQWGTGPARGTKRCAPSHPVPPW
jgi:hypothetical protein